MEMFKGVYEGKNAKHQSKRILILGWKKKKPAKRKSFAQRVSKHYKTIDNIMLMTVAKDVKKKEQERAALKKKNSYKTKLRDLEIQDAEFIEL